MALITKRQEKILNALVEEYIKTAEPVSSKLLAKKKGLKVCSSTVRNDLQELMEKGYIYQPHTSAGRAPTAKGYRLFVDSFFGLPQDFFLKKFFNSFDRTEEGTQDEFKYIEQISKNLAVQTASLVLTYFEDKDFVLKEGWEEILQNPEFQEKSFLDDFIDEVAYLEKNIKELAKGSQDSEVNVFIGRENPLVKSDDFSLIIAKGNFPNNEKGFVAMLGPARTEYEKNISLLKSLIRSLK